MKPLRSWVLQKLLPRYGTGDLPRPLLMWVERELSRQPEVAKTYDAMRRAERGPRALCGALSNGEKGYRRIG